MKYLVLVSLFMLNGAKAQTNPYSNEDLHRWAVNVVFKHYKQDPWGAYDICLEHSLKIKTRGPIYDSHSGYRSAGPMDHEMPVGLSIDEASDHNQDIVNACAIILIGGEW